MVAGSMVCKVRRALRSMTVATGIAGALVPLAAEAIYIVNQPWVLPAAKARASEAFMEITSSDGVTLIGARSDAAGSVAIVSPRGNARPVDRLPLPAGKAVLLAPNAYRLRLFPLKRALKLGDRVPLTLTIEAPDGSRQEIPVNAEVRRRSPIDDERRAHHH
jgi:copper(I)-binding protein